MLAPKIALKIAAALTAIAALAPSALADDPYIPTPEWCTDLGIRCIGSPSVQETLAQKDPYSFLPSEIAEYVVKCELARQKDDDEKLQNLKNENPLKGLIQTFWLIDPPMVPSARLPASGARLVADCKGRHVQIRGDLSAKKQIGLIKQVFSNLHLTRVIRGMHGEGSFPRPSLQTTAQTCDIGNARPAAAKKVYQNSWNFQRDGSLSLEGAEIPKAYIHANCFPANIANGSGRIRRKSAEASPSAKFAPFRSARDLKAAIKELKNKQERCSEHCFLELDDHEGCKSCLDEAFKLRQSLATRASIRQYRDFYKDLENEAKDPSQKYYFRTARWVLDKKPDSPAQFEDLLSWCEKDRCACLYSGAMENVQFSLGSPGIISKKDSNRIFEITMVKGFSGCRAITGKKPTDDYPRPMEILMENPNDRF